MQAIVDRSETAPGDRTDGVHGVKQADLSAAGIDLDVPQCFQYTVGECSRTGSTAGECQNERILSLGESRLECLDRIGRGSAAISQRRIFDISVGGTAG